MPRSSEASHTRIVAVAGSMFAEHGIGRVSLDEIAGEAQVHRTTLHRHFPGGRDELVVAVLAHEVESYSRHLGQVVTIATTASEALVDTLVEAVTEGRRNRVISALLADPGSRRVAYRSAAGTLRSHGVTLWRAILDLPGSDAARRAGAPEDNQVVDFLFRTVMSLVEEPGLAQSEAALRDFANHFVARALL